MKNLASILCVLTLLISCKSTDYLIEKGGEDVAFEKIMSDIESSPHLSERDIQSIEKNLEKLWEREQEQLSHLRAQADSNNKWNALYEVTKKLSERHSRLAKVSPLQDKSKSYTVYLDDKEIRSDIIKSKEELTTVYLKEAEFFLNESKISKFANPKSRTAARYAFAYLDKIEQINPNLSLIERKKKEALELGKTVIQVSFDDASLDRIGHDNIHGILEQLDLKDDDWTKFVLSKNEAEKIHEKLEVSITNVVIGSDQEVKETGIIISGIALDNSNDQVRKNSLGNGSRISARSPIHSTVMRRSKDAHLEGTMSLYNLSSDEVLDTKELLVFFTFADQALIQNSSFNTIDRRFIDRHYNDPQSFPELADILSDFSETIAERIERYAYKVTKS